MTGAAACDTETRSGIMATTGANGGGRTSVRVMLSHTRELAIIAGAYWAYMYTRSLVFQDFESAALANASIIISLEKSAGFFWEPEWQAWTISSAKTMVVVFNWTYIVTFWPIILTTGFILYLVNRQRYRFYRNVVLISFALAIVGFMVFPLAPPRMITDHFVDTIKAFGPAFYASRELANFYNPYAAMPSLHFAWTLMFGILFLRTPNRWLKVLGLAYPIITLLAITITANHYFMDAIGSVLLMAVAFATLEIGFRRRLFLPRIVAFVQAFVVRHRAPVFPKGGIQSSGAGRPAAAIPSVAGQNQGGDVGPIR